MNEITLSTLMKLWGLSIFTLITCLIGGLFYERS